MDRTKIITYLILSLLAFFLFWNIYQFIVTEKFSIESNDTIILQEYGTGNQLYSLNIQTGKLKQFVDGEFDSGSIVRTDILERQYSPNHLYYYLAGDYFKSNGEKIKMNCVSGTFRSKTKYWTQNDKYIIYLANPVIRSFYFTGNYYEFSTKKIPHAIDLSTGNCRQIPIGSMFDSYSFKEILGGYKN